MGNLGHTQMDDGEAVIVSINDAGEALIRFAGGARMTLKLSAEQVSSYRQAQLTERARAGTLAAANAAPADRWPLEGVGDVVIGDRNWFYC